MGCITSRNVNTVMSLIKGFAKKKNSKNPRLIWKWVGGSRSDSDFFVGLTRDP